MSSYINLDKLYDFSDDITYDSIDQDFEDYDIRYLPCKTRRMSKWDAKENRYYLVDALLSDYTNKRINYKAYIERGMNIRFLMELRKSALLIIGEPEKQTFYSGHKDCKTIQDIKDYRIRHLQTINKDYQDLDWQLYMLIRYCWGKRGADILIDYEACFADGDPRLMRGPANYRADFLKQHIPPERWIWII